MAICTKSMNARCLQHARTLTRTLFRTQTAGDPAKAELHTKLGSWMLDLVDDEAVQARVSAFVLARAEQIAVRYEFF